MSATPLGEGWGGRVLDAATDPELRRVLRQSIRARSMSVYRCPYCGPVLRDEFIDGTVTYHLTPHECDPEGDEA